MRLWQQLLTRPGTRQRLSVDDWADFFSFNGSSFPLLNTTMGQLDEESLAATASAAYHSNGPIFALVVARLQVFSQARFQWARFDGAVPTDLFGNQDLRILERPWPGGTTADLLARMEVDASLAGNSYIRRTSRTRLNRLRPDWVTIILGSNESPDRPADAADVEVVGYLYKPGGAASRAESQLLFPEEVAHYAPLPDPDAHFLGMSWVTPVIRDVQGDSAQTEHKRAFLRNAATPNLAIKFDPTVTINQVREFKALLEEEHRGAFNAWKTMYLGGGADPVAIGKDFRELDFAVTQGKAESRLAAAAGVPPSWVGFSEGLQGSALNAGNFTAARRRFGDGTMQHLWANVATSLEQIVDRPDDGAALWFTTRGIPFLAMDASDEASVQSQEAQTIIGLVKDGFTPDSAIDAVTNHDWSRLEHRGLLSVQLQAAEAAQTAEPPATVASSNGDGR